MKRSLVMAALISAALGALAGCSVSSPTTDGGAPTNGEPDASSPGDSGAIGDATTGFDAADTSAADGGADASLADGGEAGCSPSYSWTPLSLPAGQSWTITIMCALPNSTVSGPCTWNDGTANGPYSYGSTDASGNFELVSGTGNATFTAALASWGPYTSNTCELVVGGALVRTFVFTNPAVIGDN
jgi:hypothetical protein